jgi:hypothetical protein
VTTHTETLITATVTRSEARSSSHRGRRSGPRLDKAGIGKTLGLIHVEIDTLVRTPKRSCSWYADLIRTHHGATA